MKNNANNAIVVITRKNVFDGGQKRVKSSNKTRKLLSEGLTSRKYDSI